MYRLALLLALLLTGAALAAQQGTSVDFVPPPTGLKFVGAWRPAGSGGTQIVGQVIDIRQMPVAHVSVRLRNLLTGEVVATAESSADGSYDFPDVEPGTYVVEMFQNGRFVVALSNAGSIARNESMQTMVMLPGRWDAAQQSVVPQQAMAAFAGRSALTTMAGSTIMVATSASIPTVNAGEPISPNTTK